MRRAALFLTVTGLLHAQKLSFLHSVDAGPRPPGFQAVGPQAVAADRAAVYLVYLSGRRFVLRKLDTAGKELWTSQSGEAQWQRASVTTAGGGIYVTGIVDGAAPGHGGAGRFDAYLARYDDAGNQLWMRQFGTAGDEEAGAVSADSTGVYVTSATWVYEQQNYRASLRKYSPDGDLLWNRDFTGLAFWWMPLGSDGESLYLAAAGGRDGKQWFNGQPAFPFLRKYSRDGGEQWTRPLGTQPAGISGIAVDRSGVYAVLQSFSSAGNGSSVRKYDAGGNELWVRSLGTGALANAELTLGAVAAEGTGLYLGSSVRTSLPGQCYAGNGDAVVRKFDPTSGDEIWTREFGTDRPDPVSGLAATDTSVFVVAGSNLAKLNLAKLNPAKLPSTPDADPAPRIVNECVLNAASNLGGGVVPGEIVTVPVTGAVTRLLFNGVPAPIHATSDQRITAVVPFELAGRSTVGVQVESAGIVSEAVMLPVLSDRLGVFSADGSGNGQAAVVNEDGSLNSPSHPARPGSVISVYGTGGSADGLKIAISNEIIAFPEVDGGAEDYRYFAPILYAGPADGLFQINLLVPAGVPSGNAVPLHIRSGGSPVEQSLTIAIGQ